MPKFPGKIIVILLSLTFSSNAQTKTQSRDQRHYWVGNINKNIPVFVWMNAKDGLITGQVTYLKTKGHKPVTLLGQITQGEPIKAFEYQQGGTITGVFNFDNLGKNPTGIWASTQSHKEYAFTLITKDTVIPDTKSEDPKGNLTGTYSYAFGEKGPQGTLSVKGLKNGMVTFSISAVTSDPSRNIADIERTTVKVINNQFTYQVPDTKTCAFKVRFYKDFVRVEYLKGLENCQEVFGMNASVQGIYYRDVK